jgi:hypothetical protein
MHPILVQQFGAIAAEILRLSQPCGIVRLSQACERRAKEAEADQRVRGILPDGNNWGCARPGCTQVKNKSPKDMYAHLEQMCVLLLSPAKPHFLTRSHVGMAFVTLAGATFATRLAASGLSPSRASN